MARVPLILAIFLPLISVLANAHHHHSNLTATVPNDANFTSEQHSTPTSSIPKVHDHKKQHHQKHRHHHRANHTVNELHHQKNHTTHRHLNNGSHGTRHLNVTIPSWMEPIRNQFKTESYANLSQLMDDCVKKLQTINPGMWPVIDGCNKLHQKNARVAVNCKMEEFKKYGDVFQTYPDAFVKCMG